MNSKTKVVNQEMQDEMVGMLTAISIVSRRLASRLLQIDENKSVKTHTTPADGKVKV